MAKKGLRSSPMKGGLFITLEGPEGCGKTTHSKLLVEHLAGIGFPCLHTREPGGTRLGDRIRGILLHSKGIDIGDLAELFLFEAARAEIVSEVIRPALREKKIVVCDRYSDATLSYQGFGGNIPIKTIRVLNHTATDGLKPALTILLDIDTITGLRRAGCKGVDRMEKKDIAYHKRVRAGYLKIAKLEPGRIKVIRVRGSIDYVQSLVRREVELVLGRHSRSR